MSKGTTTANDLINHIFTSTAVSWDADTILYVALHTANPTATGSQNTSEATYVGYARAAVARTNVKWTVLTGTATNAADIVFPQDTSTTDNTITHVTIGTSPTGAGQILYVGALTSTGNIITSGITPKFLAGSLVITET
jgi:hypothetical protein